MSYENCDNILKQKNSLRFRLILTKNTYLSVLNSKKLPLISPKTYFLIRAIWANFLSRYRLFSKILAILAYDTSYPSSLTTLVTEIKVKNLHGLQ